MIIFDDITLVVDRTYAPVGGIEFKTAVIETGDGSEQRYSMWEFPLGRWELGNRTLVNEYHVRTWEAIQSFHAARQGGLRGFYFKDWLDWRTEDETIAIANGTQTNFQVVKNYATNQGTGLARPITRLVQDTVSIYLNGALQSGITINLFTGVVTFPSAPANGTVITADYEFLVPVRFAQDNLPARTITLQPNVLAVELGLITLEEVRLA